MSLLGWMWSEAIVESVGRDGVGLVSGWVLGCSSKAGLARSHFGLGFSCIKTH